jgi:hypothetical protein
MYGYVQLFACVAYFIYRVINYEKPKGTDADSRINEFPIDGGFISKEVAFL